MKYLVGNEGHLGQYSIDTQNYIDIIDYFKGNKEKIVDISQPYTYRVLPLLISSVLPFDSFSSLNILSIISLIVSLYFQYKILAFIKIRNGVKILSSLLFSISFPVFYFGASGFVDPFLIMVFYITIYFTIIKNHSIFLLMIFLASLSKESSIILIFFYIFYNRLSINTVKFSVISILLFSIGTFIARTTIDLPSNYLWEFDFENLIFNLTRPRAYFSYIISYSYFLPIVILYFKNENDNDNLNRSMKIGIILSNLLFIFAFFVAYPDSRLIWTAYPFTLIIISLYFHKKAYLYEK